MFVDMLTSKKLDTLHVQSSIGCMDMRNIVRAERISCVTLSHGIDSHCPRVGGREFLVELLLGWEDTSIVHTDDTVFVELKHCVLNPLCPTCLAGLRIELHDNIHGVIAKDSLRRDLTTRYLRERLR